jgi:uncharacterized membrane protein
MGEPASGPVDGVARLQTRRLLVGVVAGVAFAVVLWGGYSHRWPWTGITGGTATLWDWLHLLLLPLAVVVLPVWFRPDTRVGTRTKGRGATALAVFMVVVILGYTIPWGWTGFRGNTVWDWLKLVALPLAVVLAPRVAESRRRWGTRHTVVVLTGATVFAAVVLGGYLGHWSWTGFTGNTLWDWLNLLFLPLLVPTVVVPMLTPRAMGEVVYLDAEGNPIEVDPAVAERAAALDVAPPVAAAADLALPAPGAPDVPRPARAAPDVAPPAPAATAGPRWTNRQRTRHRRPGRRPPTQRG